MSHTRKAMAAVAIGLMLSTVAMPTAFADGKSANGCASGGWTLARYVTEAGVPTGTVVGDLVNVSDGTIEPRTHDGITSGLFASEGLNLMAILKSVDKNADFEICYKLPSGWTQGAAKQTDLLSLTDNSS